MPIVTLDVNGNTKRSAPFANPTASIGLSVANGVSNTALRSDAAQALSQAIAPTWTAAHIFTASNAPITITQGVATSGSPNALVVTGGAHTTLAASTEAIDVNINLARTVQFATGALTTQRAVVFQAPTYGFVGASTLTDAATVAITGAPVKGTNATITNTHGLLIQAGGVSTATNAYGLTVNTPTGATNNYAAAFLGGNVGIGTTGPGVPLAIKTTGTFTAGPSSPTLAINSPSSGVGQYFVSTYSTAENYVPIGSQYTLNNAGFRAEMRFGVEVTDNVQSFIAFATTNTASSFAERVRITSGGNVGIGTTGPLATTDILSANVVTNSNGNLFVRTNDSQNIDIGGQISLGGYSNGATAPYPFATIAGRKSTNTAANAGGYLAFGTIASGATTVVERMRIAETNLGLGVTAFGNSAAIVLGIATGTAPGTAPADMIQIYSVDISAGNCVMGWHQEYAPYNGVAVASTTKIPVKVNGTAYYILATTVA